ncbi:MAG: hypothetical protein M1821_001832 [Bathelium mastoideum]|nr:MAG: hypothetical protein M1821_001832 [Bathelium mastoideum]
MDDPNTTSRVLENEDGHVRQSSVSFIAISVTRMAAEEDEDNGMENENQDEEITFAALDIPLIALKRGCSPADPKGRTTAAKFRQHQRQRANQHVL